MNAVKTIIGLTLLNCSGVYAQEVYKSVDKAGNIIYSEQAPSEEEAIKPILLPSGPSEAEQKKALQRARTQKQMLDNLNRQRSSTQNTEQNNKTSSKEELQQAEADLIKAKEIGPGDRKGTATGGSRFTQSYLQRVEAAEARVEAARQTSRK